MGFTEQLCCRLKAALLKTHYQEDKALRHSDNKDAVSSPNTINNIIADSNNDTADKNSHFLRMLLSWNIARPKMWDYKLILTCIYICTITLKTSLRRYDPRVPLPQSDHPVSKQHSCQSGFSRPWNTAHFVITYIHYILTLSHHVTVPELRLFPELRLTDISATS